MAELAQQQGGVGVEARAGAVGASLGDLSASAQEPLAARVQSAADRIRDLLANGADASREDRRFVGNLIVDALKSATVDSAELLEQQLDAGAFDGLRDQRGADVKAAVVETLVGFGYPYALRISPEALSHWRQATGDADSSGDGWLVWFAVLAGAGLLEGILVPAASRSADELMGPLLFHVAVLVGLAILGRVPWIGGLFRVLLVLAALFTLFAGGLTAILLLSSSHEWQVIAALPTLALGVSGLFLARVPPSTTSDDGPATNT